MDKSEILQRISHSFDELSSVYSFVFGKKCWIFRSSLDFNAAFWAKLISCNSRGDHRDKEGESNVKLSAPQTDLLCMLTRLYSAKAYSDDILSVKKD